MKRFNISKTRPIFLVGILFTLFLTICSISNSEASKPKCRPSGRVKAKGPQPPDCNIAAAAAAAAAGDDYGLCCIEGKSYNLYKCSPPVGKHTGAHMTLASFEAGGDGSAPSPCDGKYYPNDSPVVALSTGWYHGGGRCLKNVTIRANYGRSATALVVGECDSTTGCDAESDYQPPCGNNVIEASMGVWKALGVRRQDWGWLDIASSDA